MEATVSDKRTLSPHEARLRVQSDPYALFGIIVPLMKRARGQHWQAVGTAFFLTHNGVLATARHNLADVLESTEKTSLAIMLPSGYVAVRELADWSIESESLLLLVDPADIAQESRATIRPFAINCIEPSVGDAVHAVGISRLTPPPEAGPADHAFYVNVVRGEILDVYSSGIGSFRPFPCFYVGATYFRGMSGGPVLADNGTLLGLVCSGYDSDDDALPTSSASFVHTLLPIELPEQYRLSESPSDLYGLLQNGQLAAWPPGARLSIDTSDDRFTINWQPPGQDEHRAPLS